MFIPNTNCKLYRRSTVATNFGKHSFLPAITARCAIVSMAITVQKSSVRADTSGSRGQVEQTQGDAILLFPKFVKINLGDVVFKDDHWLEVIEAIKRYAISGEVDHIEVTFRKREAV